MSGPQAEGAGPRSPGRSAPLPGAGPAAQPGAQARPGRPRGSCGCPPAPAAEPDPPRSARPVPAADVQLLGVLAVDAGNSKTDVALVASDGRVLGTAHGAGFAPQEIGAEAAVAGLAPLVARAAEAAGLRPPGTPGVPPLATHVSACLANADLPVEEQALQRAVAAQGWGRTAAVANDTFAVLRAGLDVPRGVAVVCGAGINCVGLLPDGRTARFPALGRLTGDWGGGAGLAVEAMWWAVRAEDGRGPRTALATAVPAHFGRPSTEAVALALHLGELPEARLHELVPVLFAAADGGDEVARGLVERQAAEITAMAVVALRRLGLLDGPADVVLGGGVLAARHPLLLDAVAAGLAAQAPLAVPRVVDDPPVVGAALLGLDRLAAAGLGGGDSAQRRLRAHYPAPAGRWRSVCGAVGDGQGRAG